MWGERNTRNEKQYAPVLSVTDNSRHCAAWGITYPLTHLHKQLPPSSTSPVLRGSGKEHNMPHLSPNIILCTLSDQPQRVTHWSTKSRASGRGWVSKERRVKMRRDFRHRGWGEDINGPKPSPPCLQNSPLQVTMPFCHPSSPADLNLARSKKQEDRKNSLFLYIPLVLNYALIPPQAREASGLGGELF